ncbi:hypothetical protein [uncultured Vibrio sp.]|uniref:hypothetical protein n=1 Tax=uncultured Vibrio sp. TaxID=114054 RepID=UPI0025E67618|nr:hypothetical protein [uncultured Vibrio sp.]
MKLLNKTFTLSMLMMMGTAFAEASLPQIQLERISHYQEIAFENRASKYTDYAQLFNLCQQTPNATACGKEYKQAEQTYLTAKARSDVLDLLVKADNYMAPLPGSAYKDLASVLETTGYISDFENVSDKQLLTAVNQWNQDNGFDETDRLLLIQLILIQTDASHAGGGV